MNKACKIGSRLELFVDDQLIESLHGNARRRLHRPVRKEAVITFDSPWEGTGVGYPNLVQDENGIKLYYRAGILDDKVCDGVARQLTCMATSKDGLNFNKPELDLVEVDGSKRNNVILEGDLCSHNFTGFLDKNPAEPDERRYKAVSGWQKVGFMGHASPDGIHWNPYPEGVIFDDARNYDWIANAFWHEEWGEYLAYLRTWVNSHDGEEMSDRYQAHSNQRWRDVRMCRSRNFLEWHEGDIDKPSPDHIPTSRLEYDQPLSLEVQHYTNYVLPYPRAPQQLLMFPMTFNPMRKRFESQRCHGISDTTFCASRDGTHWKRWREAFIRPGLDPRSWSDREPMMARGLIQTSPEELSVYWLEHNEQKDECARLVRGSLRLDGFVSLEAGWDGGELVTRPIRFNGDHLLINHATSAMGRIRVEIQDESGTPIPGYDLDACPDIYGNDIEREVSWRSGKSIGELDGKTVKLRFHLQDADLFSYCFSSN